MRRNYLVARLAGLSMRGRNVGCSMSKTMRIMSVAMGSMSSIGTVIGVSETLIGVSKSMVAVVVVSRSVMRWEPGLNVIHVVFPVRGICVQAGRWRRVIAVVHGRRKVAWVWESSRPMSEVRVGSVSAMRSLEVVACLGIRSVELLDCLIVLRGVLG